MASFDLPENRQSVVSPALLVGVASPLWTYFGAAAVGGMAYWWLTQWTRPANLEALMGGKAPPSPEPFVKPVLELVETAADAAVATPVGGEAAPISPLATTSTAPAIAPEPVAEAAPPPAPSVTPEAPLEAKAVEHLLEEPKPSDAQLDAAAAPAVHEPATGVSEFTARPKVKKAPTTIPEA
ncbi:MAG TPA: hypothetical protein VF474_09745 [Phenylobacterium sp.]